MTVAGSAAALTKVINNATKELDITEASLDAKVTAVQASEAAAGADKTEAEGYRDEAAAHAVSVAADLTTMLGNVTFEGIGAILAEKAVTAVDVFVYDTSLDSDGGAWRKRCQHTSWHNEPLNTATRGARREFPAVAVIVVEGIIPGPMNRVTIYDADDPALPMWMVLNGNSYTTVFGWANGGGGALKSCAGLNGTIAVVGGNSALLSFPADDVRLLYAGSGTHYLPNRAIADRNSTGIFLTGGDGIGLASVTHNDVAMTVVPDAPTDLRTGLPIPTIAVATDSGTTVINFDGSVFSSSHTESDAAVVFTDDFLLVMGDGVGSRYNQIATAQEYMAGPFGTTRWAHTNPTLLSDMTQITGADKLIAYGGGGYGNYAKAGLARHFHGDRTSTLIDDRLACFANSDYVTGWMAGDVRGVFLGDTDTSDLVGADLGIEELVLEDFVTPSGNVTVTDLGDRFRITRNAEAGTSTQAYVDAAVASLAVGELYFAEFEILATGPDNNAYTGATHGGGTTFISSGYTTGSTKRSQFSLATGAGTGGVRFGFSVSRGSNPSSSIENDWIEVSKIVTVRFSDFDRIRPNRGLIPAGGDGRIYREPVAEGAELAAYYGFRSVEGSERYLVQPYNSDLDFRKGDFSIMFWVKDPGGASTTTLLHRQGMGGADVGLYVWRFTSSSSRALVMTVGNNSVTAAHATPVEIWSHVVMMRRGGELSIYHDGVLSAGGIANSYEVISDQPMYFGVSASIGNGNEAVRYALLRISATAPNAEQIAKIYEDERKLFMPGAKCTLYGMSDAVTALAHDPKTRLLHVGTSQGRSVFDGLLRVANTETPVGTAISAVNGLIAEQ